MYKLILMSLFAVFTLTCKSAPYARITRFGSADGLSDSYVFHGIQDSYGYIWFCTRNGLVQYDGYRFTTYKSYPGDDCPLETNRIDFVEELPDHDLRCHSGDNYYIFHRKTRRFELVHENIRPSIHSIPDMDKWVNMVRQIPEYADVKFKVRLVDNQGGIWIRSFRGLERISFRPELISNIKLCPDEGDEYVSCLYVDKHHRLWIGDKNHYLHILDEDGDNPRYLAPDGRISGTKVPFGHDTYTVFEDSKGRIWIGTKPDGLFCLTPSANGYKMARYVCDENDPYSISTSSIYCICEDAGKRIWIGTFGGGLNLLREGRDGRVSFINKNNVMRHYPSDGMDNIRSMSLQKDGTLLIGTTGGLVTTRLRENPADMRFFVNKRRPDDKNTLGNNDIMSIQQDMYGNIFVATNGGGISLIKSSNILSNNIRFKHYTTCEGLATDACLSLFLDCHNHLWTVGELSLTQMDMKTLLFTNYMKGLFSNNFLFQETKPVCLSDGDMVFATNQGILRFNLDEITKSSFVPKIRFACADTLVITPDNNTFTIQFAALDYNKNEDIVYMYKIESLDSTWIYTKDNKIHFTALPPGEYRLVIRSTNGDGVWVDNEESIMIYRKAAFNETYWSWMLYSVLLLLLLSGIYKTAIYIHKLNREIKNYKLAADEKLEYMANHAKELTNADNNNEDMTVAGEMPNTPDELFAAQAREFVGQNYRNSDINVDSFARSMGMSRSLLYLKCKAILGTSPNNYIIDYRIGKAREMLMRPDVVISDVAFAVGFSDPKYFSRCFKKSTGLTPKEYNLSVSRTEA